MLMARRKRGRPREVSPERRSGFALRFYRARQRLGLTQEQVADLLGVGWASVARWETAYCRPRGLALKYVENWIKEVMEDTNG